MEPAAGGSVAPGARSGDSEFGPCVVCGTPTGDVCETVDRAGRIISVVWQCLDCGSD